MRSLVWAGVLSATYGVLASQLLTAGNASPAFLLRTAALGLALVMLSVIDIDSYRLPDWLTLPLAAVGCCTPPFIVAPAVAWHVASAALGFLSLFLVAWGFKRYRGYAGLGLGDAKLFGAAGAWLGAEGLPIVLLTASALALASAAVAHLAGAAVDRRTRLPFGPFLAVGTWIVWLAGPTDWIGWD